MVYTASLASWGLLDLGGSKVGGRGAEEGALTQGAS
jgi:hypothetical protein